MKLLDLTIENFGVYSARHFDFSGPGFRLIYGPNEAGKSTLLQLIREVLFGFPHVSPYVFENHTGKLAATVRMEMHNGRRVRFRRQKGTKGTVTGEIEATRQPVDDDTLHELLGQAGGELFQHVFGFSLTELSAGEKSLQHANLTEALYGSGVGGLAGFQRLQQSLLDEHQKMFSPRARKPVINQLLTSISERSQQLRDASVRPREYNELQESLEAATSRADDLSRQLETLRLKERRLERLESALGAWSQSRALREEMAQLGDVGNVSPDVADRFRQARERRDEAREELNRLETSLALLPTSEDNSAGDAALVCTDEALVRRLSQDVSRIRDCISRIPTLLDDAEAIRQSLLVRVRQLNPDWSIDDLARFQATEAQRELVRELEAEWNSLQQQETGLTSQRPELQRQLEVTQSRLESLSAQSKDTLAGLEDLIERSAGWSADRARLADVESETVRLSGELESLLNRLRSAYSPTDESRPAVVDEVTSPHGNGLATSSTTLGFPSTERVNADASGLPLNELRLLVLPLAADVEAARTQQGSLTLDTRRAGEQLQERQQELQDAEQQLRDQEASESVVTIEAVQSAREERDVSWKLIRRNTIERAGHEQRLTFGEDDAERVTGNRKPPVPSPDEFERSIAAADALADDRFSNAESVARREHLIATVERARHRVEAAQTQLQQCCAACESAETHWKNLWPECIQPGSPDAMLEWLRLHADLIEAARRRDEQEADAVRLRGSIEAFEAELIRGLQTPLQSPEASLAQARELCGNHRRDRAERDRLSTELPDLAARLRVLDDELNRVKSLKSQWHSRWTQTASQLGVPSDWSVQTAGRLLGQLAELQLKQREAESLKNQAAAMQAERAEFESQVARLVESAPPEIQSLTAADAIVEIVRRIDASRQSAIDQQKQASQRNELLRQTEAQTEREQKAVREIETLLAECGVSSTDEFLSRVEKSQKRRRLNDELELRERDIRVIRGSEDEADFVSELQGLTPEGIATRRQSLQQQISQLDAECQQSLQQAGAVRRELESLNSNVDSIQIAAELESLRSELGTAVDSWAGLVVTRTLMTKALERFEREHQPRMLQDVARLLSQMTDGRYTGIERKLDRAGTLLVRDSFGDVLEPAALSTGTREQLYLAIRLAFVLQYCEDSEPLPLIMDDILVNFDHKRSRNTLSVLAEVSKKVQILFLTCHRHMADLAGEVIPNLDPLVVNEDDRGDLEQQRATAPVPLVHAEPEPVPSIPQPKMTRARSDSQRPADRQAELF